MAISTATLPQNVCPNFTFFDVNFKEYITAAEEESKRLKYCVFVKSPRCNTSGFIQTANYSLLSFLSSLDVEAECETWIFEMILYCAVLVLCVAVMACNAVNIILLLRFKQLRTVTTWTLFSLAWADMLSGLSLCYVAVTNIVITKAKMDSNYANLEWVVAIKSQEVLCLLFYGPGLLFMALGASNFSLLLIALEKYIAIFHPYTYPTLVTWPSVIIATISIWIFAGLLGLAPLMGWNSFDRICAFAEVSSYSYTIVWSTLCFLSAVVIALLYACIFVKARRIALQIETRLSIGSEIALNNTSTSSEIQQQRVQTQRPNSVEIASTLRDRATSTNSNHPHHKYRPTMKMIKTIALLLTSFYVCWIPFLLYLLIMAERYSNTAIFFLLIWAEINGLFNPLVYGLRHRESQKAFKDLCCMACKKCEKF
ncbi:unnamed protein product [Owenia fusiformis]|uniref:Uncharacterized protein n=1 Tax=Owenia fusiformis TaxID=6347 RepID=A0A8J1TJG4_OWEFU|nr:unnamed protein product [Owenia fusiformis]